MGVVALTPWAATLSNLIGPSLAALGVVPRPLRACRTWGILASPSRPLVQRLPGASWWRGER